MSAVPLPLAQTALTALNHVLAQQQWARDRLRAHAGRTLRIRVLTPLGTLSTDARVAEGGTLEATSVAEPTVILSLTPSVDAVFGALRDGTRALSGHLKVEGDVMLAAAVGEIAQQLRWEVEEDLSRVMGDAMAHRIGQSARTGWVQAQRTRDRIETGLRQYLVEEDPQLVGREALHALEARLQALETRLGRLESQAPSQQPGAQY